MGASNTCDVLVIGGGIAGLTATSFLSKAGLEVLLCEKEKTVGGLVNSYEHNGCIFDGGLRSIENSGIVFPMLRQLGVNIEFAKSIVSIGIGHDVIQATSKESLADYQELLNKHFPDNKSDIEAIIREVVNVMEYMDVLYGIDNPLFMDLGNLKYIFTTIMPWLFKYLLTIPKISKLKKPIDEYLTKFSGNQALIDMIAQHFFQKTPASFALSYFSLYLDYHYPKGGTGSLVKALEKLILQNGGVIRNEVLINRVDIHNNTATDSQGNSYHYKNLVWAADLKTFYRIIHLEGFDNPKALRGIQKKKEAMNGKVGGDSVFTLNLIVNLDRQYFSNISTGHFFYTATISGLSYASLKELENENTGSGFTSDKARIKNWLKRYLELTTYEISIPALRDETLAPKGKTALIISSLFDYSLTKHIEDAGWYEEFKDYVAECMVEVLDASIYNGLKTAVIECFSSTPLTMERIAGNSEGAITGWAFTNKEIPAVSKMSSVAFSVLTPIPNVYQAGQWTFSPSGLPISILTGKLAADKIIEKSKKDKKR